MDRDKLTNGHLVPRIHSAGKNCAKTDLTLFTIFMQLVNY